MSQYHLNDLQALSAGIQWVGTIDALRERQDEEQRRREAAQAQAEIRARQQAGLLSYQQDIGRGMAPLEAIKRHGANLYAGNPAAYVSAVRSFQPKPVETWNDEMFDVNGRKVPSQVNSITHQRRMLPYSEPEKFSIVEQPLSGGRVGKYQQSSRTGVLRSFDVPPIPKPDNENPTVQVVSGQDDGVDLNPVSMSLDNATNLLTHLPQRVLASPYNQTVMDIAKRVQANRAAKTMTQPSAQNANQGVRLRDKKTGKTFFYRGNKKDVPLDKYDIL